MRLSLKTVKVRLDKERVINVITNDKQGGFKSMLYPLFKTDKSRYCYVGYNGFGQIAATTIAMKYQKKLTIFYIKDETKYLDEAKRLGFDLVECVDLLEALTKAFLVEDSYLLPLGLEPYDEKITLNIQPKRVWMLDGSLFIQSLFPDSELLLVRSDSLHYFDDNPKAFKSSECDIPFKTNSFDDKIWGAVLNYAKDGDYVWTNGLFVNN